MQSHNRLSRSGRSSYTSCSAILPFDDFALIGMEKYCPLVARKFERSLQFLGVGEDAEPAQCVGMSKGIFDGRSRNWRAWFSSGGQFEESFGRFSRQTLRQT